MRFLSNFGCKIIFMCSVNFWHQQESNSLFKGSIGHVTYSTHFSVSPQSRSPFSSSLQTFCLTVRANLNTQKYGLFCSLEPLKGHLPFLLGFQW